MDKSKLFVSNIAKLKNELRLLRDDMFPNSYKRIEKSIAGDLLKEIENLEKEHAEMKLKLQQINDVINSK